MKKLLLVLVSTIYLSGCAGVLPSFWDDNQSYRAVDIQMSVDALDCSQPHAPQVKRIKDDIQWFLYYSEAKGWLQSDVIQLIEPMQQTVGDFYKRSTEKQGSVTYCNMKKKILVEQSKLVTKGVLSRWGG